jgi:hypothetical protein
MLIRTLIAVAALSITAIATAGAQAPPMDMSWGIRNQMLYQQWGDMRAYQAGQACYQYSMMMRARGYYGPINCGANAQTLQQSISRANQATQNYIQGGMYNSWVRGQATNRANQAITGQYVQPYNCWYYGRYVC